MSLRARARRTGRAVAGLVALALVATLAAACQADDPPPPPQPTDSPAAAEVPLTFGAYGPEDELTALGSVTQEFNALYEPANVEMETYDSEDDLIDSIRSGKRVPDVFMVSRDDLRWLLDEGLTQPVDDLLDERGVDFGDDYSRDGIQAFSVDNRLQCMPYGISPMVIFYNKELVDFERMQAREIDAPDPEEPLSWSFDQFAAAADFATRPRKGTKGVYGPPTLSGLAPYIYSGGGQVFDDQVSPTSLAFSEDSTQEALERSLELFRNPTVTLSEQQLRRRTPLEWFERGKLGMLQGYRGLVPHLRQVQGLDFDVIAMPVLDQSATVGEVTGLCMSKRARSAPFAADFMVHVLDTPAAEKVTKAGYLVPANVGVALSDDFLQPGRLPVHSEVFNTSVRNMVFPPLLSTWPELEQAVSDDLEQLLNEPILDNLDEITQQIDEESQAVLSPETESPSPSEDEE